MKRILIFTTAYLPLIGGAEIAIKELTDRLGLSFSFDLICARIKKDLPPEEESGCVKVHRVGWGLSRIDKLLLPWRGLALAKKLHRENNYQAIWAVMASYGGLAALFFKKKFPQVPYVLTLQEGDSFEHINRRARWLGPYFKQMFKQADCVTAISQFLASWAGQIGVGGPVEVVANGVDIKKFEIRNLKFEMNLKLIILNFKQSLNINDSDKVIITVSRLVKKNAVDDIVKAMQYLPVEVKLLIVGEGPERKMLENLALELKLADRVIFAGQVANEELPKFLALADVFVRPSLSEGQGIAFLEAMAAGVPVIATPVGGIVDFLIDGETGRFCAVKNPKSIAEKAAQYISDQAETEKIKASALELVRKNYDWDLIAVRMKKLFEKIT